MRQIQKVILFIILVLLCCSNLKANGITSMGSESTYQSMNSDSLFQLANTYYTNGELLEASKLYKYYVISTNDSATIGLCYKNLSDISWRLGNNQEALESGIKALDLFKGLKQDVNRIKTSYKIIQIQLSENEFVKARALLNEVKPMIKANEPDALYVEYHRLNGVLSFFEQDYTRALKNYKQALVVLENNNDQIEVSISYGNIAEVYETMNKLDSALYFYNKAITIQEKEEFWSGLIFLNYGLGKIHEKKGSYSVAIPYYEQSIALMNKVGEKREMPYVLELLANVYATKNEFEKAYLYQTWLTQIKDSLSTSEKQKGYEELKIKFEVNQAEYNIQLLRKENSMKSIELSNKHDVIILQKALILLVLLGIVLSSLFTYVFFKNQKQLKIANQTKDKLFSIIGHDLRGPIGSLRQLTGLLLDLDEEADNFKMYIPPMHKTIGSAYELLDDLLAWAQTQGGSLVVNLEEFPISSIVQNTIDLLDNSADQKKVKIISLVDEKIIVRADIKMITAVVRNLTANAIKFSFQNSEIVISSSIETNFVKISVTDNGVGIKKEDLAKVLNPNIFYSSYGTKNENGTGLGLMVVQEFVKINNGLVELTSTEGHGSTFAFTVPISSS